MALIPRYPAFTQKILAWQHLYGRKHLPWQVNRSAYRVWVSEIMLQQTQVSTVLPYYTRFLETFSSVAALARAPLDEVLHLWAGLGYYSRARNLHKTANIVYHEYHASFPTSLHEMMALPGIGRSTAGAILAFSQQQALPILDANVKRVLTRCHAIAEWPGTPVVEKKLWELATQYTPRSPDIIQYTQAIMDLGATVCTHRTPQCALCPLAELCIARKQQTIQQYPARMPKKIRPVKKTFLILLRNPKNEVLLERRPEAGIWGGLWSLPESTDPQLPPKLLPYLAMIDIHSKTELPSVEHTFSHFKLIATPLQYRMVAPLPLALSHDPILWHHPQNTLSKGLPALIKKILLNLRENTHE